MEDWLKDNLFSLISLLCGTGGVVYAIIMRIMDSKKYAAEVEGIKADADVKGDTFWKNRYSILENEIKTKDDWWKDRYDNLYKEYLEERKLNNEMIKSFRSELNELRNEYEKQREEDKTKYDKLYQSYKDFEKESLEKSQMQLTKIQQLEKLVEDYEKRLNVK